MFKKSLLYGALRVAIPVFSAVNPISLAFSSKNSFFSISLATIGSITIVVFPVPEEPTINVDSNLLSSAITAGLPSSASIQRMFSQVYGPIFFGAEDKSIPLKSSIESFISKVSLSFV